MKRWKVTATVEIIACRTFLVEAENQDAAKQIPFDDTSDKVDGEMIEVTESFEEEVTPILIKTVEPIF
jgi:hypothetical protein